MGSAKRRGNREGAVPGRSRIIINRGFAHHLLKLSGQGPSCCHRDVSCRMCVCFDGEQTSLEVLGLVFLFPYRPALVFFLSKLTRSVPKE